jgi:hypothetical protein
MSRTVQQNQYDPNSKRAFNQFTSNHYDTCEYENELRMGSKPMKYYVNQLNSPQTNPFMEFTPVGNKKSYGVKNMYDRPLPTRLNAISQSYVLPYTTTPFLGSTAPSREFANTESSLRFGNELRPKKSAVGLAEVDLNRWDPGVNDQTVQNAGQFVGGKAQSSMGTVSQDGQLDRDGFFDYKAQNNVLFANSAWPYFGISSRNEMQNSVQLNDC